LAAVSKKTKAFVYRHKNGRLPDGVTEQSLDSEINAREDAILKLEKEMNDGNQGEFTGVAFISFQTEEMKQELIKRYEISHFQRFRNAFQFLASKDFSQGLVMNGNQRLYVSQASEPGDVYWKNLHLSDKERYLRKLCGYLFSSILLFLCAMVIYNLLIKQNDLQNDSKDKKIIDDKNKDMEIKALTALLAILIVVINKILGFLIPIVAS